MKNFFLWFLATVITTGIGVLFVATENQKVKLGIFIWYTIISIVAFRSLFELKIKDDE